MTTLRPYLLLLQALLTAALITLAPAGQAGAIRVSEEGRRASSPEIAIGPDGAINVIWLDKGLTADRPPPKPRKPGEHSHRSSTDLYFARSEDGGSTWSTPVRVNDTDGEVWGFSVSKPRIGVGPSGTIHVFYPANDRAEELDKAIVSARYRRSTDNGRSFSAAVNMNRPVTEDREDLLGEGLAMSNSFGTMGVAPDGTVITAWQNVATMKDQTAGADGVIAVSTDDGESFSKEIIAIPGNKVCPCCQLTIEFGDDFALMGLRYLFAEGRDSMVARSDDGGMSFGPSGRLDFAPWDINGCPLKPTELAIAGDTIYAAAYTGGEDPAGLYFTRSTDGGRSFSGKQQVHPAADLADAPALSVDNDGQVRLVWHTKIDGARRLYTAVSTDSGKTFSAPLEVATPPGKSMHPASAVAADGSVFVTWEQENEEVFVISLPQADQSVAQN